jgi:hypothetical protein
MYRWKQHCQNRTRRYTPHSNLDRQGCTNLPSNPGMLCGQCHCIFPVRNRCNSSSLHLIFSHLHMTCTRPVDRTRYMSRGHKIDTYPNLHMNRFQIRIELS